ncbi:MAG: ABC transporter permease [Kineosporiaceae bacterium]|nr:ABC transporter permease [Kineosporiaceae bacterium]
MSAGSPEAGVIHDIGYRHYRGVRLGRWPIVRALFVDSLRGAFGLGRSAKSKIAPLVLLALMTIPALVAGIVVNVSGGTEPPFPLATYPSFVYPLLILYVGGQAPAGVSRDLRFRVTTLYFSRPLGRTDYVAAKLAALTTAVALVMLIPLVVLTGGLLLSDVPAGDVLIGGAQSLLAIALLAPMLAGIALAIASVTPRRGLGVAAVVAVLIIGWAVQGAVQGIVASQGREDLAWWSQLISPGTIVDGLIARLFDLEPASGTQPTGAAVILWGVAVAVVIAGAIGALTLRYRRVSVT